MRNSFKAGCAVLMISSAFLLSSFYSHQTPVISYKFPYQRAGLTERQAAEYLISRFTYGATPGQVDLVMRMGLENWFAQQLDGVNADDSLNKRLAAYDAIGMTNTAVCHVYPPGFVIRTLAIKDSAISKDSVDKAVDKKAFNAQIKDYMDRKGFKNDQDLYKQFIDQHIIRAVYSQNQLREMLTDFWFNHFNVSFFKGECAQFIPAYERDVIRPNAMSKFDQLLLASAKSPAMLYYLDNFTSVGPPPPIQPKAPAVQPKTDDANMLMTGGNKPQSTDKSKAADMSMMMSASPTQPAKQVKTLTQQGKNVNGLNENYAREVMELHTLGVDGGYTQTDVTEAARVLTGWTVYPISDYAYGSAMKGLVTKIGEGNLAAKGYVHEGDFLFTPNRHDQDQKVVLGHTFPASKDPEVEYQEGLTLLEMLAHQPSAAKFIARKLAVRFVNDTPPQSLINKMAKSFTDHDGDIREVLITMVTSKEFWNKKNLDAKVKSPFELVVSSLRALNADVKDPYPLFNWMAKMGQKIYYYQAPTGFPDRAAYWINTGALLDRMDFGLALTGGQVGGVSIKLGDFSKATANDPITAAKDYSAVLLPGTDPNGVLKELTPLLNDPVMLAKLAYTGKQLPKPVSVTSEKPVVGAPGDMALMSALAESQAKVPAPPQVVSIQVVNNKMNSYYIRSLVAGIIIGSPDFQKR
ncbi:DUF1800 domain-containing protein [Mucilaginibacter sp. HC2]|uniref:DUF1800 domain-containing protein n=1 Tax=Mucilaginibacter inviolabilis TaxID=2714892 RepID=UPI00140904BA|nr:DUF1800 domain-containing protein [Mucilaginibacter inviolabilis]NHA03506.1 DUF1800 domain-containing protein [Mucilaginibacter inviolabilis]